MDDFDWNHIKAFHTTAETGTLSAAARRMGVRQSTVSRQVAALEAAMGVTLFDRIGKSLKITEAGLGLLAHVKAMAESADALALAATGQSRDVAGRVSISASDIYAAHVLPGILKRVRAEAPQITIDVISSNQLSDLRRREADIALRHVRPTEPELICRAVRPTSAHFYAAQSWLDSNPHPIIPGDIAASSLIAHEDVDRFVHYLKEMGLPVEASGIRLLSSNSVVVWEMVKMGLGVTMMLRDVAEATPGIVQILADLPAVPVPLWLVTHRELQTSRRIRIVFDILGEELTK